MPQNPSGGPQPSGQQPPPTYPYAGPPAGYPYQQPSGYQGPPGPGYDQAHPGGQGFPQRPDLLRQPVGTGPASPEPPPQQVQLSFWLWVASVVVGLVGTVLGLADVETIRAQAEEQATASSGGQLDQAAVDAIITFSIVVGIAIGVLFTVATLVFAVLMRRGRNWARILLAVIAGLSLLSSGISLPNATAVVVVVTVLGLVVTLAAVILMFLRPANEWFAARRR